LDEELKSCISSGNDNVEVYVYIELPSTDEAFYIYLGALFSHMGAVFYF